MKHLHGGDIEAFFLFLHGGFGSLSEFGVESIIGNQWVFCFFLSTSFFLLIVIRSLLAFSNIQDHGRFLIQYEL